MQVLRGGLDLGDAEQDDVVPMIANSFWELLQTFSREEYNEIVENYNQELKQKLIDCFGDKKKKWPKEVKNMTPITESNFAGFLLGEQAKDIFFLPNRNDWVTLRVVDSIGDPSTIALKIEYEKEYGISSDYGENEFMSMVKIINDSTKNLRYSLASACHVGFMFEDGNQSYFLTTNDYKNCFDERPWKLKLKNDGWYDWNGDGYDKTGFVPKNEYQYVEWDKVCQNPFLNIL